MYPINRYTAELLLSIGALCTIQEMRYQLLNIKRKIMMISCVLLKPKQPLLFIVFSNISQTFNCSNELIFVVIISRPQKENDNREINVS